MNILAVTKQQVNEFITMVNGFMSIFDLQLKGRLCFCRSQKPDAWENVRSSDKKWSESPSWSALILALTSR